MVAAMLHQRFQRRKRCSMPVPFRQQIHRLAKEGPAAVTHDSGNPMSLLLVVSALPVMGAGRRFGNEFRLCRLCGNCRLSHRFCDWFRGRFCGNCGRLSRESWRHGWDRGWFRLWNSRLRHGRQSGFRNGHFRHGLRNGLGNCRHGRRRHCWLQDYRFCRCGKRWSYSRISRLYCFRHFRAGLWLRWFCFRL